MSLENKDIDVGLAAADDVFASIDQITASGQPFEIATKIINNVNYTAFVNLPKNLHQMYHAAADLHDDKEFLVYLDERYSFRTLYQQSVILANALVDTFNVQNGDKIAIAMRNYPEWIIAFMAITSIGAIAVPLNSWWKEDEFTYALKHSESTIIFADERRAELLTSYVEKTNSPIIVARSNSHTKNQSFEYHLSQKNYTSMPDRDVHEEDIAAIFYTSGSTGNPKGAVSRHLNILSAINTWLMLGTGAAMANGTAGMPVEFEPVALMTVPLFHVTGCHTLFLLSMIAGRKTIMMDKWDATEALRLIQHERVTYFNGVPTMSMELLNHPDRKQYDLSSLADICAGGAKRPPQQVRDIYLSFDGSPSTGYGLTETNALGTVNGAGDYLYRPSSAGMPTHPIVQIKVIDEQNNVLPNDVIGEISIKAVSNIKEYWRNPEATAKAFTEDGYFKTGDLGFMDAEGFVFIVDRKKDIIIRGGENISCLEVEAAIYRHPSVAECAVFSVPDERLGEIVGSVIYIKSNETLTTHDLIEFLTQRLAGFKIPEKIELLPEQLPKLGSGKIDKKLIKKLYA